MNRTHQIGLLILCMLWSAPALLGQTTEPAMISAPEFILSDAAIAAGVDGQVTVGAVVGTDGKLKDIRIFGELAWPCGTHPKTELDDTMYAILDNLWQIHFSPGTKKGKPREVEITFTFAVGKAYEKMLAGTKPKPPVRIDAGIVNGKARVLVRPEFPAAAKARRLRGTSSVFVLIGEDGKVISAGAFSGAREFYAEARDAACRSRFSPTLVNDKPVQVQGVITYNFVP